MTLDNDWMSQALCRLDEPDWLFDRRPDHETLSRMGAICAVCPVSPACASYALANNCEAGIYAGVWLPQSGAWNRHTNRAWLLARKSLIPKARAS